MSSSSTQRRRLAAERLLAQLRRAPGDAERPVDRVPRRARPGSGSSAATYAAEPVARTSAVPNRSRLGDDELDRHALDRHADRAPLVLLDHRDDLRQRGEARQHRLRIRRGADHRQPLAGVAPAPHVAGRPRRRARPRSPPTSSQRAVEQQPAPRPRLALAGERLEQLRLGLRPDARHGPQPARGRRLAKLLGRADAERPRELDRALRAQPEVAAEADELGRELALELRQLGDRRRSRRARAAAPRSPGRSRAARAPARTRTSSATGTGAPRIVSAARR